MNIPTRRTDRSYRSDTSSRQSRQSRSQPTVMTCCVRSVKQSTDATQEICSTTLPGRSRRIYYTAAPPPLIFVFSTYVCHTFRAATPTVLRCSGRLSGGTVSTGSPWREKPYFRPRVWQACSSPGGKACSWTKEMALAGPGTIRRREKPWVCVFNDCRNNCRGTN